jgi:predicted nucleic acid-binding Zn ribbon protein
VKGDRKRKERKPNRKSMLSFFALFTVVLLSLHL